MGKSDFDTATFLMPIINLDFFVCHNLLRVQDAA